MVPYIDDVTSFLYAQQPQLSGALTYNTNTAMRTDEDFVGALEKLQSSLGEWYRLMKSLNEQAERICVTLKAVTKETRLELRLKTMQEQTVGAEHLALGTSTAANNLKRAEKEIGEMIGRR